MHPAFKACAGSLRALVRILCNSAGEWITPDDINRQAEFFVNEKRANKSLKLCARAIWSPRTCVR